MYYVNTALYYRSYPIAIVSNTNNNSLVIIVVFQIIIDKKHVQKTTITKFHLSVKIDLVDEVYYLKLVFYLLFYNIPLNCQNRFITISIPFETGISCNNNGYFYVLILQRAHCPFIL